MGKKIFKENTNELPEFLPVAPYEKDPYEFDNDLFVNALCHKDIIPDYNKDVSIHIPFNNSRWDIYVDCKGVIKFRFVNK